MKKILFSLLPCLLFAACSQESAVDVAETDAPEEILLEGGVSGVSSVVTRASVNSGHTGDLAVKFARYDQNVLTGVWPANNAPTSILDATFKGSDGNKIVFAVPQYYLVSNMDKKYKETRLVGWHPNNVVSNGVVNFDSKLDGFTDIMLTPVNTGSTKSGGLFKPFTFNHLLSQINVVVKASDTNATGEWGKVKSIQLTGLRTQCQVTLGTSTSVNYGTTTTKALTLCEGGKDTPMTEKVIPAQTTGSMNCGYCLFPPTAGKTLILNVTTVNGGSRQVTITSPDNTFEAGKNYVATLTFSSTTISSTASIASWGAATATGGGISDDLVP